MNIRRELDRQWQIEGGGMHWEREKRGDSGERQRGKEVAMERGRRGRSGSVCYEIISNVSGRANV